MAVELVWHKLQARFPAAGSTRQSSMSPSSQHKAHQPATALSPQHVVPRGALNPEKTTREQPKNACVSDGIAKNSNHNHRPLTMKAKLLGFLPRANWLPHDIPSQEQSSSKERDRASKPKSRSRIPFSLKHSSSSSSSAPSKPNHGSLRRRTSNLSLSASSDAPFDARTHAQMQSMFFAKLPLELRRMVYEYVVGAETVHLTLGAKRRFGHFVCEDEKAEQQRECGCRVLVGGRVSARLDGAGLKMLRACRRVYLEGVAHLYRPHTFSLLHVTHLLYLPSRVPQPRLDTVRKLQLRWAIRALPYLRRSGRVAYREDTANWESGWAILAGLQGLRELSVVLVDPTPNKIWQAPWMELEEELLEPVCRVVAPRQFEVMLPYESCLTEWDMGDSKVVFRRPGEDRAEEVDA